MPSRETSKEDATEENVATYTEHQQERGITKNRHREGTERHDDGRKWSYVVSQKKATLTDSDP
jgi:hypothetical protein